MGMHLANCLDSFDNGVIRCGLERYRACFGCDILQVKTRKEYVAEKRNALIP
jgi:hypothetical protein